MRLEWVPEGIDHVTGVRRGRHGELRGKLRGTGRRWSAEILDERPQQSFAWKSSRGSDCAGLITFHPLSRCLTRIELSLDVRPTSAKQAIGLATRLADRRAGAELRRFKAAIELISPDNYEPTPTNR